MLCYSAEAQLELFELGFMSRVCDLMQFSPLVGILEDCGKTVQMMMRSNAVISPRLFATVDSSASKAVHFGVALSCCLS